MISQNLDKSPIDFPERTGGKSADGRRARRPHHHGSEAWRETVTQHMPETWPAARLSLQARIAALDLVQDEALLELSQVEAA